MLPLAILSIIHSYCNIDCKLALEKGFGVESVRSRLTTIIPLHGTSASCHVRHNPNNSSTLFMIVSTCKCYIVHRKCDAVGDDVFESYDFFDMINGSWLTDIFRTARH